MKDGNRCQTKDTEMFIRHQISVPHASSWTERSKWFIVVVFCCNYRKKWSKVGFLWTILARNKDSNLISSQAICFKVDKKDVEKLPSYLRTFKCRNFLPLSSKGCIPKCEPYFSGWSLKPHAGGPWFARARQRKFEKTGLRLKNAHLFVSHQIPCFVVIRSFNNHSNNNVVE